MTDLPPAAIDSPELRRAGRGALSLALMDARNHTLDLLGRYEQALTRGLALKSSAAFEPPVWIGGHVGWLAERCLARNPQWALGTRAPFSEPPLASIDPRVDSWFDPARSSPAARWRMALPPLQTVRDYLLETLETTLDLLDQAGDGDAALDLFRAVLFHEDARGEQLVAMAQSLGLGLPLTPPAAVAARPALLMPATRWTLGIDEPGFTFDFEQPAHLVDVPEFEIDAQPVSWAQFVEFVDDGAYDRPELWHPDGWAWLQALAQGEGRRGPRYVEQIGVASGAVLQAWFGKPWRMSGSQPVMHASWWEADAWARWAGRRLPTEVEWEIAAQLASTRGFRWGDVLEWTAGTLRPWPGYVAQAWSRNTLFDPQDLWGRARVQRGASFATRARLKHAKARRFALPERDEAFTGFRTCVS